MLENYIQENEKVFLAENVNECNVLNSMLWIDTWKQLGKLYRAQKFNLMVRGDQNCLINLTKQATSSRKSVAFIYGYNDCNLFSAGMNGWEHRITKYTHHQWEQCVKYARQFAKWSPWKCLHDYMIWNNVLVILIFIVLFCHALHKGVLTTAKVQVDWTRYLF